MFEKLNINQKISKEDFSSELNLIIADLVTLQYKFKSYPGSLVIIINGFYGSGVDNLVNFISNYIDMRHVKVAAFWQETYNIKRPYYYRFWNNLPERGKSAIFLGGWYTDVIEEYVKKKISNVEFENRLLECKHFEKMLSHDNTIILKLWLYIDKTKQYKYLKKVENGFRKSGKEIVEKEKWHYAEYEAIYRAAEKAIVMTNNLDASWHLVEAHNERFTKLKVLKLVHNVYKTYSSNMLIKNENNNLHIENSQNVIEFVNPSRVLKKEEYNKKLTNYQKRIFEITWKAHDKKINSVIVFEGLDAAGKGGCIRRLTNAMDTRLYNIHQISAPSDMEKRFHYLWRFWNKIPLKGFVSVFDRSWYGRVLVERVENFASYGEWNRAYEEINSFEHQLADDGIMILKIWLHISPDEQLRRFNERQKLPWKKYKITDDDWLNREKWDEYEKAANEMLTKTSTSLSPWIIVPANNKYYARIEVMKHFYRSIKKRL